MKLLLTSAGLYNQTIANELGELTGKKPENIKIGFIPTAANAEEGDKGWFFEQIKDLNSYGYKGIDVVDISAKDINGKKRLLEVDVIAVSGGNTFHLLAQIKNSGFDEWLIDNLEDKVYIGMSAGSIVTTPNIGIADVDDGDINFNNVTDLRGLNLVNFELSPHTPEDVTYLANEEYFEKIDNNLYTLDNNSAISVNGEKIKVISEGEWKKYDK